MADLAGQITAGVQALTAVRETTMVDVCTVTRPGDAGQTPALDAGGNVTVPADSTVYTGPCTFADPKQAPIRKRSVEDEAAAPEQRELRTPHSADLRVGDLVQCTASAFSPGLVGDTFAVVREDERSYATYRRYILRGSAWEA